MSSLVSQGQALVKSGKATSIPLQEVGKTGTAFYTCPYLKVFEGGVFALKANGDYDPSNVIVNSPCSIKGATELAALGQSKALSTDVDATNIDALFDAGKVPLYITGPWSRETSPRCMCGSRPMPSPCSSTPLWTAEPIRRRGGGPRSSATTPLPAIASFSKGAMAYQWLSGTGLHLRDVPDAAGLRLVTLAAPVRLGRRCCCLPGVPGQVRHSCRAAAAGLERPRRVGRPGRSVGRLRCPAALRRRSRRVVEHLYHLRSLGVDVPYLTPFFPSRSNHRYDASSFDQVDPALGGAEFLGSPLMVPRLGAPS